MSDEESSMENATEPSAASRSVDVSKTHAVAEFKHEIPLTTCRIDPTGRFVFAGAEDFNVYRWEIDGVQESKTTLTGHQSWVRSMDFSPDGQWLYTGGYDHRIGVWRATDPVPVCGRLIDAHKGWVRWVRVNHSGQLLASCGNDHLVKVWALPEFELVHELKGHERFPYAAEFHPDGRRLVSFDLMGMIREWDLDTGKPLRSLEAKFMWGFDLKFQADMGGARDLCFSPDGKTLAVAGLTEVTNAFAGIHKPMILLVDWDKGEHQYKFKADSSGMAWGVRFHPDGFIIGVGAPQGGNKGMLWFWNPGEEKAFHTITLSHCGRGLDLTPDATRIAVAQFDGHLRIYRMTDKLTS
ncbi:MAG: WD40 repeat domain-containing protein [Planctomycetaceae bacterium]|jgi:WD40 repeat protein